jgi:hypothetical protein
VVRRRGGGPAGASVRALWAPTRRPGRAGPAPRRRGPGRRDPASWWRPPARPRGRRRPWPPGRVLGLVPFRRPPRRRSRRRGGRPPWHRARGWRPRGWVSPVRRAGVRGGRWEHRLQAASMGAPRGRASRAGGRPGRWVGRDAAGGSPHHPDQATDRAGPMVRWWVGSRRRPTVRRWVATWAGWVAPGGPGGWGHALVVLATRWTSGRRRVRAPGIARTEPARVRRLLVPGSGMTRPARTALRSLRGPMATRRSAPVALWPVMERLAPAMWRLAREPGAARLGPAERRPVRAPVARV